MARLHRKLLQQRKELIERYVRLVMHRWISLKAKSLTRRLSRIRLQWSERKLEKALVSNIETLALETARARRLGFEANAAILNLGLFFLIADRDIQAVKIDALTHPDSWRRGLAARLMLLTIHELDINKVAGNRLKQALNDGTTPDEIRREVTEAMRTIRKAQSKAKHLFVHLRNSTIAHRDQDALQQYRDIVEIDGLEITRIAADFYSSTGKFIEMIPKLLAHLSTWRGMIDQLQAQADRRSNRQ